MEALQTIIYEQKGHVAWITLNRPEVLNVQNNQLRRELIQALEQARDDKEVHVLVLTGAGDKAFCAGADVNEFLELTLVDRINQVWGATTVCQLIREIPKPVIAMVNGFALGGGNEIVLACDLAISSENALFGQLEIKVGVIPGAGGTQILTRLIGQKRAKELIFTGRTIAAPEALKLGIINSVVPKEKLREAVEELVGVLLKRSPIGLKLAKMAIDQALETTLSAGLAHERELFAMCFGTEDRKEGVRAFIEKREPIYKGR